MECDTRVSKESMLVQANQWEYCTLRVGYEVLLKFVRKNQRSLEKEISKVVSTIIDEGKKQKSSNNVVLSLKANILRLEDLKQKLIKAIEHETLLITTIKTRLDHANVPQQILKRESNMPITNWYSVRLSRVIFDYLMREGYRRSAQLLLKSENLDNLIDSKIYSSLRNIVSELQQKKCGEALKWCGENRTRLKKSNVSINQLIKSFIF